MCVCVYVCACVSLVTSHRALDPNLTSTHENLRPRCQVFRNIFQENSRPSVRIYYFLFLPYFSSKPEMISVWTGMYDFVTPPVSVFSLFFLTLKILGLGQILRDAMRRMRAANVTRSRGRVCECVCVCVCVCVCACVRAL